MDTPHHTLQDLFAQLGLDSDESSIRDFIQAHRPLPMTTRITDAPFWTPSQTALLREKLQDDSDWCLPIDSLNAQLRESGPA